MVEVFKTNVQKRLQAEKIVGKLLPILEKENSLAYPGNCSGDEPFQNFPKYRINFDLDDCDKILRVEGENICPEKIIAIVQNYGFRAEILE